MLEIKGSDMQIELPTRLVESGPFEMASEATKVFY